MLFVYKVCFYDQTKSKSVNNGRLRSKGIWNVEREITRNTKYTYIEFEIALATTTTTKSTNKEIEKA